MNNEQREQQIRDAARYKYPDERIHFIDGAKWADQHPAWIPVEERLPKENEEVLAYNFLFKETYLCVYRNGKFEDYLGELGKGAVSHWMLLPQPPQEKEE